MLGDIEKTAILDIRSATEGRCTGLEPQLRQAVLRRLPDPNFAGRPSPSALTGLCGLAAA